MIDLEQALAIHQILIERFGGAEVNAIMNPKAPNEELSNAANEFKSFFA